MFREGYDDLVNAIVRPPRATYEDEMLGPAAFDYGGKPYERLDATVPNKRGLNLKASLWRPTAHVDGAPCVVYLHGNASCRVEGVGVLAPVLAMGAMLAAFDFAGCGHSDGTHISLGFYERDDVATIIEWVRAEARAGAVGLWGRSMGAASAIMHASRDASIAAIVCDSPFASIEQIALDLVSGGPEQASDDAANARRSGGMPRVPLFLARTALRMIASSVKSRASFDLYKVRPIDTASTCFCPALFGTAHDDILVRPHHSRKIVDAYAGDKNLVSFEGDHNDHRPGFFADSAIIFFRQALMIEESELEVPLDQDGRPVPLFRALGRRQHRRSPSAALATVADRRAAEAEEELLRQALEASLSVAAQGAEDASAVSRDADVEAAEAEMLAEAIQRSLDISQ